MRLLRRSEDDGAYALLHLSRNDSIISDSVVKKAFQRLALVHHPDKGGDPAQFDKVREFGKCHIHMLTQPAPSKTDSAGSCRARDRRTESRLRRLDETPSLSE